MEPNELLLIRIDFISHISAHSIKTSNGRHFWQTVTFTCMTATNNAPVCSTPRWGWLGRLYWLLRMRNEAERGWKRKRRRWKSQVKTRVPLSLLVARRRRKKKHVRASQQLRQFARLHYSPGDIARNSTTFYSSSQQKWKEGKEKENSYCNNNNNKSMLMSVSTWILFLCFVFSLLAKGMRRWHRQAGDSRRGRLFLFCHPFPAGARHRENKTSKVASSQQPSHPFWFSSSKVVASLTRGHGRSVVRISRTALKVPFFPQPNQNKTKANDKSTKLFSLRPLTMTAFFGGRYRIQSLNFCDATDKKAKWVTQDIARLRWTFFFSKRKRSNGESDLYLSTGEFRPRRESTVVFVVGKGGESVDRTKKNKKVSLENRVVDESQEWTKKRWQCAWSLPQFLSIGEKVALLRREPDFAGILSFFF